ncbi:MAG: hypothetical protein NZ534_02865, partial [Bacteroidia bacterium]|nr:hypothetical protein [Bacteroidia bacterium]
MAFDYDSPLSAMEENERIKLLKEGLLKSLDDSELIQECKEAFYLIQRDSIRRYLVEWDEKLDERRRFI